MHCRKEATFEIVVRPFSKVNLGFENRHKKLTWTGEIVKCRTLRMGCTASARVLTNLTHNFSRKPKEKKPLGIYKCKLKGKFKKPSSGAV